MPPPPPPKERPFQRDVWAPTLFGDPVPPLAPNALFRAGGGGGSLEQRLYRLYPWRGCPSPPNTVGQMRPGVEPVLMAPIFGLLTRKSANSVDEGLFVSLSLQLHVMWVRMGADHRPQGNSCARTPPYRNKA